jgi:hypothetical protein
VFRFLSVQHFTYNLFSGFYDRLGLRPGQENLWGYNIHGITITECSVACCTLYCNAMLYSQHMLPDVVITTTGCTVPAVYHVG